MPYEVKFEQTPAGIVAEVMADQVKVQTIGFVSSEDGDTLIQRLEGFGSDILSKLPESAQIVPGRVSHLLAIIRRDRTATVYLNELQIQAMAQPKRSVSVGQPIFVDDIADVLRLRFADVVIPKDAGIVFIFSAGWRRAMFFDLLPLHRQEQRDRDYDIEAQLGSLYAYLLFQERFKIKEQQWKALFDAQWFPFIGFNGGTLKDILSHACNQLPLDNLVDRVAKELTAALPNMLARWKAVPVFADHLRFVEQAVERYLAKDFISTTSILYPRIEGIMRSHQKLVDPAGKATQSGLSSSAVKDAVTNRHEYTPLLPERFRQYLKDVYFADFDPKASRITVSRNSVGHGVATAEECSLKAATISLLLVDQLAHAFSTAATHIVSQANPAPVGPSDQKSGAEGQTVAIP